ARVIKGELPGDRYGTPQRVLIIGDEDGYEDTWIPRLYAAGASVDELDSMVLTLDPGDDLPDLARAAEPLLAAVHEFEIGWTIFDQLLDHIPAARDGSGVYNAKHVRDALRPFRRVASESDSAVTANMHPVKG